MSSLPPQKRNRLLLWLALAVLLVVTLWVARGVLFPYIVGLVLAYLLLPLVNWIDRRLPSPLKKRRISRPMAIILTYVLVLGVVGALVAFLVPLLVDQVTYLIENWPELSQRAQDWGQEGWRWYQTLPESWRATIQTNLQSLAGNVLGAIQAGVVATVSTLFGTVGFILGFVVIPFWLFYILQDEKKVKDGAIGLFPERLRPDILAMARLVDDVLSAYIRGQLLLMLFVGTMATIATGLIGVPFFILLGFVAGLFEVLPYIGPILGAIPAVLVALLNEPVTAIYVIIAYFAIQQVENLILVPRIAGNSVKLHPAVVMVVLVIGNQVGGFLGMVAAVPIAAIIRDVFKYLYLRLLDEPLLPAQAAARVRSGRPVRLDL